MRGNAGRAVSVTPVLMPGMEVNASCPRGRAGEGRPRRAGRMQPCERADSATPSGPQRSAPPGHSAGRMIRDFAKSRISAYIRRVVTHCGWIRSGGQHPCSPGDSHKQISHERVFPGEVARSVGAPRGAGSMPLVPDRPVGHAGDRDSLARIRPRSGKTADRGRRSGATFGPTSRNRLLLRGCKATAGRGGRSGGGKKRREAWAVTQRPKGSGAGCRK